MTEIRENENLSGLKYIWTNIFPWQKLNRLINNYYRVNTVYMKLPHLHHALLGECAVHHSMKKEKYTTKRFWEINWAKFVPPKHSGVLVTRCICIILVLTLIPLHFIYIPTHSCLYLRYIASVWMWQFCPKIQQACTYMPFSKEYIKHVYPALYLAFIHILNWYGSRDSDLCWLVNVDFYFAALWCCSLASILPCAWDLIWLLIGMQLSY